MRTRSLSLSQRFARGRLAPAELRESSRRGGALLNIVVAVVCLLVLLALIVPSVQQVRSSRRTACLNNMKNLALATLNYAVTYDGALPLLEDGRYGWPVLILPQLDHTALARQIRANEPAEEALRVDLPVFVCPDDSDSFGEPGGLSYAANAGYGDFRADSKSGAITEIGKHSPAVDRDGDGQITARDLRVNYATGVFWRDVRLEDELDFRVTLDFIEHSDGQGQTLLFAENANAGRWHSRATTEIAFVIGREVLRFEAGPMSAGPLQLKQPVTLGPYAFNGGGRAVPGPSPVPSSSHDGVVTVSFCDGRARMISDQIDPGVYARLMTPAGERFGQAPVDRNAY